MVYDPHLRSDLPSPAGSYSCTRSVRTCPPSEQVCQVEPNAKRLIVVHFRLFDYFFFSSLRYTELFLPNNFRAGVREFYLLFLFLYFSLAELVNDRPDYRFLRLNDDYYY
jgi:hypothetical protein